MSAKRFDPILDAPPVTLDVGGVEVPIDTGFEVVLSWFRLQGDKDLDDHQKAVMGIKLFLTDDMPDGVDVLELYKKIQWFIMRGEEPETTGRKQKEVFNLTVDSGRIFAAFMQTYRINLRTARMHWWTFAELLDCIPGDTKLAEVIKIRSMDTKGMTAEQKRDLARAKKRYRIGSEADPMAAFANAMRGIT